MSDSNNRRLRDAASGPGTLISQGCKVEGMLRGIGNFLITGEVDGECEIEGSVTLAQGGVWKGVIRADSVIVAGTIDGDIIASGQVEISDTAKITGTVSGEAIAVAEGAVVEGVMKTTGQSAPQEFVEKRRDEDDAG
ncbi:MAG: polymer-forming cytoskeletal protein [Gammaproteobacteria bacterium]|nr:polymer-forming cytoskeletal protein [Gammaproteobacteria bacterium]